MPTSSSKRKKRPVRAAKPGTRTRKNGKDWRFRSRVIGKSHDSRDVDLRRRVDNEKADQEMLRRHGLLEQRPKGAPRSLDERSDRWLAQQLAKVP